MEDTSIYSTISDQDYHNVNASNESIVSIFEEYPQSLMTLGVVCSIVMFIVGVSGNLLTILALLKTRTLWNATTAFIINLSVVDGIFCISVIPAIAATYWKRRWPLGNEMCAVISVVGYMTFVLSVLTVMGITVNRYVLILHPQKYCKLFTKLTTGIIIASLWAIALTINTPIAAGVWGSFGVDPKSSRCAILKVDGKSPKIFISVFYFGIPSVVFLFCYGRIFHFVRKVHRKNRSHRYKRQENQPTEPSLSTWNKRGKLELSKDLKLLRVIMVIFVVFVICYLPATLVRTLEKEGSLPTLDILGFLGIQLSSCLNPIIYVAMSQEYRRAYKRLCVCIWRSRVVRGSNAIARKQKVPTL